MGDLGARLMIVGAVVVVVAIIWVLRRPGRAYVRRQFDSHGLDTGWYLFASRECGPCGEVSRRLSAAGIRYSIVTFGEDSEPFVANGIDKVPTLVRVKDSGGAWRATGTPTRGRLLKWSRERG